MTLITAVAALGGLSFLLSAVLVVANRRLFVFEDPRIDAVEELLPLANCGACGVPGCRPFAEALVKGEASPASCTVSDAQGHKAIADLLQVDVGSAVKRVARLACAGGANVARDKATYKGLQSCAAAALAGGGKACSWGCLGLADCQVACDFGAIHMDPQGLPVVDAERCTACGDCVTACPKDLFSVLPAQHRLFVACRSQLAGDEMLQDCAVGCNACGRCAMDAPELVRMVGNLPVVDTTRPPREDPIRRCPTGAIVWLDAEAGPIRGPAAKKIVRKGPLPAAPS